jgi:hypothetical protein
MGGHVFVCEPIIIIGEIGQGQSQSVQVVEGAPSPGVRFAEIVAEVALVVSRLVPEVSPQIPPPELLGEQGIMIASSLSGLPLASAGAEAEEAICCKKIGFMGQK